MTTRRWLDRHVRKAPEQPCTCGHTLGQHPADQFRSCALCVWCDDFRDVDEMPPRTRKASA